MAPSNVSLRELLGDYFGPNPEVAERAREALRRATPRGADEARAVLEALDREPAPRPPSGPGSVWFPVLALVQQAGDESARRVFLQEATPALISAYSRLGKDRSFCLKLLASIGTREGLAFVAEAIADPGGPADYLVDVVLQQIDDETPHVAVLFPTLARALHYPDFRAVVVVDLANRLARSGRLRVHPAAERPELLERWIDSRDEKKYSYAVSACAALAFIPGPRTLKTLLRATEHPDADVRLEAHFSQAVHNVPGAYQELARATLDPAVGHMAIAYLEELGKQHLIPREAQDPAHRAKLEMVSWLKHPTEYGRPPTRIELWDRRILHWPPTRDVRELFLFRYSFEARRPGEMDERGVGLVGSMTFSMWDVVDPEGTPEDAYAAHCMLELEWREDPRAVPGRPVEVGRRLLGFDR